MDLISKLKKLQEEQRVVSITILTLRRLKGSVPVITTTSQSVEYLKITPVPLLESTHVSITEGVLNQTSLDFLKNITIQGNHQQQQGLNNQLNDSNFFLYNNVLQGAAAAPPTAATLPPQLIAKKTQKEKKGID